MAYRITSKYGQWESFRNSPHRGVDFGISEGTKLKSVGDGTVERIVDFGDKDLGKGIFIKMDNGDTAIYGHLKDVSPNLDIGDKIQAGEFIGYSGNTGFSTGEHLHFAIKHDGSFVNPESYVHKIQNMDQLNIAVADETGKGFLDILTSSSDSLGSLLEMFKTNIISLDWTHILDVIINVIAYLPF